MAGGEPDNSAEGRSAEDAQYDLEEGALDPDELHDDPLVWDEGVDDELG